MSDLKNTTVIFDSRTARSVYKDLNYYRSADIKVPAGYIAVVELTTHKDYMKTVTFTALRIPNKTTGKKCYDNCGLGKRYRRWKCCQSLGKDIAGSNTDGAAMSVVRWGNDTVNQEEVEFEYITRPGNYYLIANKCSNEAIEDCENPTIIEVTLVPVSNIPELALPCCSTPVNE